MHIQKVLDYMVFWGPMQSELGPPISIINQENDQKTCPQVNVVDAFSQLTSSLPRCPVLV